MTPGSPRLNGSPVSVLRRITSNRPPPVTEERCEMCAEPIAEMHQHVVNLESRVLMCTCRGCYLLFTEERAELRYRAVPENYVSFPDFTLGPGQWDQLEIPVGLAFLFRNSVQDRIVAFYPGPAGATESELPLDAWDAVVAANPALGQIKPDVEALLIRAPERGRGGQGRTDYTCNIVPIDACYELVGGLRQLWRGFDGGQDAHDAMDRFFEMVSAKSRPARSIEQSAP
ncbi:MAG: hypothetical protein H0U15_12785 [Geodermatophilaceae bacterium]|nr:hypothetical protein [Geodermatophilaceae bacterium]